MIYLIMEDCYNNYCFIIFSKPSDLIIQSLNYDIDNHDVDYNTDLTAPSILKNK